ncbi:hypothetical protein PVAP13_6NG069760 [Panicum virgatum]|uniref:Uncharacterized protein n=1 Tax=Panicum virgatum TaxID=38727 RepID=A0A8T0QVH5_PANVG|nr:hypothetical protein PVAP13_6NG069760 [Panicum virgatum]
MLQQFTANLIPWLELVGCCWTCSWGQENQLNLSGTAPRMHIMPQARYRG